ncbi:MAG: hypothetical protein U0793_04810 [Gemmataceae bacterium]
MTAVQDNRLQKTTSPHTNPDRRRAEAMLRDIAFVLKMTARVKKEIVAGR